MLHTQWESADEIGSSCWNNLNKSGGVFFYLYYFTACDLIFFHPKGAAGLSLVGACMTGIAEMFLMSPFLSPLERDWILRFPKKTLHFKVTQLIWSTELCSPADQLAQETKLSKTEVDCWFSERRGLRDNMEKALLTMASKSTEDRVERPGALLNGASHHREQDGKSLHSSPHPPILSSSSSSSSPPVLAASSPHPPTLSASASPPILTSSSSSSPHPPILSASTSPAPISSRSLGLLREVRIADENMSTPALIKSIQIWHQLER